jgi:hypothetical protein
MLSPISSVTSCTISGSSFWTRVCTASRIWGGRSFQSWGCSRCMVRSTTSRMSVRELSRMCSAIASGSSCS